MPAACLAQRGHYPCAVTWVQRGAACCLPSSLPRPHLERVLADVQLVTAGVGLRVGRVIPAGVSGHQGQRGAWHRHARAMRSPAATASAPSQQRATTFSDTEKQQQQRRRARTMCPSRAAPAPPTGCSSPWSSPGAPSPGAAGREGDTWHQGAQGCTPASQCAVGKQAAAGAPLPCFPSCCRACVNREVACPRCCANCGRRLLSGSPSSSLQHPSLKRSSSVG